MGKMSVMKKPYENMLSLEKYGEGYIVYNFNYELVHRFIDDVVYLVVIGGSDGVLRMGNWRSELKMCGYQQTRHGLKLREDDE